MRKLINNGICCSGPQPGGVRGVRSNPPTEVQRSAHMAIFYFWAVLFGVKSMFWQEFRSAQVYPIQNNFVYIPGHRFYRKRTQHLLNDMYVLLSGTPELCIENVPARTVQSYRGWGWGDFPYMWLRINIVPINPISSP